MPSIKPPAGKTRKVVWLDDLVIRAIQRLAIDSPQKNCKNYMEWVLEHHALTAALRKLQNTPDIGTYPLTPDEAFTTK